MRILILNQAFYPDVVSTAQHASDLAVALAGRGHEVAVVCSRRAYDNPALQFSRAELWKNIRIARVNCLALGKQSRLRRALVFASFMINCALTLLRCGTFDVVVAMTSPPLISFLAALLVKLRGGRFIFWVMDLNPDEAIAAGWLRENTVVARVLSAVLRHSLRRAERIVVLDRFMKQRVERKGAPRDRIVVIPPWPHETAVHYDPPGRAFFRERHGLTGKFVVMYSGNHSPCHSLDTLLDAAKAVSHRDDIAFCFVGSGSEFRKVQNFAAQHAMENVLCLPYQPLDRLSGSLSAADLHVVVLGAPFVGVVHPCKIYNILALGIPVLYIGPSESHITNLLRADSVGGRGFLAGHGEVDLVVSHITHAAATRQPTTRASALPPGFSERRLVSNLCELIESNSYRLPTASSVTMPCEFCVSREDELYE